MTEELAKSIATKCNLPRAGNMVKTRFEQLIAQGQYQQAAKLATDAHQNVLRTPETLQKFKDITNKRGGPPADLQYYTISLENGPLTTDVPIGTMIFHEILNTCKVKTVSPRLLGHNHAKSLLFQNNYSRWWS